MRGPNLGIRAYVDALWTVVCVWSGRREVAVLRRTVTEERGSWYRYLRSSIVLNCSCSWSCSTQQYDCTWTFRTVNDRPCWTQLVTQWIIVRVELLFNDNWRTGLSMSTILHSSELFLFLFLILFYRTVWLQHGLSEQWMIVRVELNLWHSE